MSDQERVHPADCTTMAEVRQGVDALDRALVALLVERQDYMDAAARNLATLCLPIVHRKPGSPLSRG